MNVFIRAMVRIFSFAERLIVPFNSAIASLNGTINLSPHENILTIAHTVSRLEFVYLIPHGWIALPNIVIFSTAAERYKKTMTPTCKR